jgi:GNAT superfamily N-acetyltransferase
MDIRTANESDAVPLVDLWTAFMIELHGIGPATTDGDAWSSRLHRQIGKSQVCVAETDGDIAGFAGVIDRSERNIIPRDVAYLVDLYVTPHARECGVASALLDVVIRHAARAGYGEVWTNTSENNAPAQACLAHAGFRALDGFVFPGLASQRYLRRSTDPSTSPREVTIRTMMESDDERVSDIVSQCYRLIAESDGLTQEQCDRSILERSQPEHMASHRARFACHVAEQNGSVVGFIAVSGSNVEELFVDPKCHRCGVATALFRKVESDCEAPILTVGTTGYGVPFYEAMGMHITGRRLVTFGPLKGRELIQLGKRRPNQAVEATSYFPPAPHAQAGRCWPTEKSDPEQTAQPDKSSVRARARADLRRSLDSDTTSDTIAPWQGLTTSSCRCGAIRKGFGSRMPAACVITTSDKPGRRDQATGSTRPRGRAIPESTFRTPGEKPKRIRSNKS